MTNKYLHEYRGLVEVDRLSDAEGVIRAYDSMSLPGGAISPIRSTAEFERTSDYVCMSTSMLIELTDFEMSAERWLKLAEELSRTQKLRKHYRLW